MKLLRQTSITTRLSLVLLCGLLFAHALSFALLFYERYEAASSMLMANIEHDVVVAVNMLDRLPPEERADWLPMLRRRTFHYRLDAGEGGAPVANESAREMAQRIGGVLAPRYQATATQGGSDSRQFEIHLRLADGSPMTIDVRPSIMPVAQWLPYVFAAQLVLLLLCTWAAVRVATRPLARLQHAAETLSPAGGGARMDEEGPSEVKAAATAFNAMQDRITRYTAERVQILAAVSHDLQTPITRMNLRAEAMEPSPERDRILEDLRQMQHLAREGIAYARSAHAGGELLVRVDIDAFLDSVAYDYHDTGRDVTRTGRVDGQVTTRLHALRRVLTNLLDNAVKYAGAAQLDAGRSEGGRIRIRVRDRGPGIPEHALDQVLKPFYRLEASRNRATGGTGLGLAIAQQLAESIGATLTLRNRYGGGLDAALELPA